MYSAPETGAAIRSIRLCSISFPHVRPDRAWRLDARMELNPLQNNAASACDPIHTLRDTETSVSVHPNTARADPSKAPCTVDTSLASALIGAGSRAYEIGRASCREGGESDAGAGWPKGEAAQ